MLRRYSFDVRNELRRAEEVPLVAVQVLEDRDMAIGLGAWRREELNTRVRHSLVGGEEVVHAQEETHATCELAADQRLLLLAARLSEQDATA